MALIVTTLGLMTISDYNRMMKEYDHAYENAWRGERLNHLVSNVVMETRGLYIARDDAELQGFVKGLNQSINDLQSQAVQWKAHLTPEEATRYAPIEKDAADFIANRRAVAQLAGNGQVEAARNLSTANRTDRKIFQQKVDDIVLATLNDLSTAKAKAERYNQQRATDFFIACLTGIALMAGLSLWIVAHFITRPLRAIASAIIRTSKGDYSAPLEAVAESKPEDEIAAVWGALRVLKTRAIEAEHLAAAQREAEHQQELKMRELILD